jgi:hypothetical protein
MICCGTHRSEDQGCILSPEILTRGSPCGIIIYSADCHIAIEVDSCRQSLFESQRVPCELSLEDAFPLQVLHQRNCLILPNVSFIKSLTIQVAHLDDVIVKNCERADSFAHERRRDMADEATSANAQDLAPRENLLIEARDFLLAVLSPRNRFALDCY